MGKKKLLLLILTLSLIIVIGGSLGIYFYLTRPNSISGWNEFKDDYYGYSVKYPKEWFIYPDEIHKPGYSTDITSFDLTQYSGQQTTGWSTIQGELSIHIAVDNFVNGSSLDEWLKDNPPPIGKIVSQKEIIIDGFEGIEQTVDELGKIVYLPKGDKLFIIHAEPLESLETKYNDTFNTILGTLKFTK